MIPAGRTPVWPHSVGSEAGLHTAGEQELEIGPAEPPSGSPGRQAPGPAVRPPARWVFGEDDRERVRNTRDYPWRTICHLRIAAADGTELDGTGWLAAPRLVATAGHCLFDPDHGGLAREVEIFPGRDGQSNPPPFGSVRATSAALRVDEGWRKHGDRAFDFGAIVLPAPAPGHKTLGDRLGFFGLAVAGDGELEIATLNLAGYPKEDDKELGSLWWHGRTLNHVEPHRLLYHLDTEGGQSGSPIWRLQDKARQVVGIHIGAQRKSNLGLRLTRHVFDRLLAWAAEEA